MLTVKNLSFCYRGKAVLSNVSFELEPESITALLGPNGAGKTTLLRCLDLILKPSQGDIFLNGTPLSVFSPNTLARKIAYMPQQSGIAGLTVFDAVLLGRKPYLTWNPTSQDYDLVEKTLKRLHLSDKSLRTLDCLSGGELQKVSLARIFVQNPQLILLDEPMSALDLKNRVEIMRHLTHFVRHNKASIILSVHDLNDALRFADRLLFLKNGELRADETVETISAEILSDIYDLPLEICNHSDTKLVIPPKVNRL